MRALALCLTLAMPGAAFASCPTAADLDGGVRMDVEGGEWETFRRVGPEMIESIYWFDQAGGLRSMLAQGIYLVELIDWENGAPVTGTRDTWAFPFQPGEMPSPTPGASWGVSPTMFSGGSLTPEPQEYLYGDETQITIGACSYTMIPITIRYIDDQVNTFDVLHYLKELGVAYLAESTNDTDGTDIYRYIDIRTLP